MVRRIVLVLVMTSIVGISIGAWFHRSLTAPLPLLEAVEFEVRPGATLRTVLRELEARDAVASLAPLELWARLDGTARGMHTGEYRLQPGMDGATLLHMLSEGRVMRRHLVLLEGWRFTEVREALAAAPKLDQAAASLTDDEIMTALERPGRSPEGRFFPDTYDYVSGDADLDVLARAARRMDEVLDREWSERLGGLPLEDPDEALVLASLIEKETGAAADRERIAGVFVRRLEQGMRLQTDPSVIHGLGDDFDGNLTRAHLRTPHPWNTYVHRGLPPTPIALPGRAALRAALHPEDGDALYFVARGDGTSEFSVTLEAHNAAVRRFQIEERARDYRSRPADDQARAVSPR